MIMNDELKHNIEQGKFYFRAQNYKSAEKYLTEALAKKKDLADVNNMMGLIAHQDGSFSDAIKYFERALKTNPRYTEALMNLSILYNDMGEYEKAKKLVARSRREAKKSKTAMDPFIRSKLANKHAEVGDWYRGIGGYEQAAEEYQKALDLEDKYVDIRTKKAICLREAGNVKDATKELKQAIKDNPKFLDAHIQLGVTFYADGKKAQARKTWKEASAKFPRDKTLKMYLKFSE